MDQELALYRSELSRLLDRLRAVLQDLGEAQLNWQPDVIQGNSIYVLATHILGNAEAWVLGIACEEPIARDRPSEFRASGPASVALMRRAQELEARMGAALDALPPGALNQRREPSGNLWGEGNPHSLTVRQALIHVVEHGARHLGQIDVTRDLVLAQGA